MIDAVLSFHANPHTCGVTKFNEQLAERLGVRHHSLSQADGAALVINGTHPLLSLKAGEMPIETRRRLASFIHRCHFDVLWHDDGDAGISALASNVYYAKELGCPSTLRGNASRKGLTILSYGMAHKFVAPYFTRLKELLDESGRDYTICVSSAIHEGSPWDETTKAHTDRLRDLFGDHLRWLGFLGDDALAREIREAHTVALFYDPAVRANNTTIWAALDAGTPVITNLDAQSPSELVHNVSVFDLAQLTEWPEYDGRRQDIRAGGVKAAQAYSWDRLIEKLTAVHA